jgi:hypothetical protein
MTQQPIREPVRVMFHLNGYTKVLVERTEGLGLADGGIVWDISTQIIPFQLRKIGSRFIVKMPSEPCDQSQIEIERFESKAELET